MSNSTETKTAVKEYTQDEAVKAAKEYCIGVEKRRKQYKEETR